MLYEFKSRATGSVFMIQSVAEHILHIIGKTPGKTGIITVDQIPGAVAALRQAIEEDESGPENARQQRDDEESVDGETGSAVSLAQRAYPFIELIEAAHKAGKDVTWGV